MDWTPISQEDLAHIVGVAEGRMSPPLLRLWQAIKIAPQKWQEKSFGQVGGGFWVVAVIGRHAIWFNDIEDGFDISSYKQHGELDHYACSCWDSWDHIPIRSWPLFKARRVLRTLHINDN